MVLIPAYGKTYDSEAAIKADWEAGKDFKLYGRGCYTSIRDLDALMEGTSSLTIISPLPCNARFLVATM